MKWLALFLFSAVAVVQSSQLIPNNWPTPVYNISDDNLTVEKIQLGRLLFYDAILSRDGTISCSSCHSLYNAFAHTDHALSHGINDRIGRRNAPALMNLAWMSTFMWDGAINHLDMQALAPITHVDEMGESMPNVIDKLQGLSFYRKKFYEAFGDSTITGQHLLIAIAQFSSTLISANSKYDKVMLGSDTFSDVEQKGFTLFSERCAICHTPPLFTSNDFASNGIPIDSAIMDMGRMEVTSISADSLLFKIPSLRNVEFTYPYMHDGRFKSLYEVLNHYNELTSPKDKRLENIQLTENQKVELVSFMLTLTDREFLFNQEFAFPKELLQPRE
ncbi:MAG: cytochrome-c peroxidase [Flavobacteriales bacterium]|nr:cytochrome-c peroxidase [Flavobacteriales bacterium]